LVDLLYQMLKDKDTGVISNVICALNEILVSEGGMAINTSVRHIPPQQSLLGVIIALIRLLSNVGLDYYVFIEQIERIQRMGTMYRLGTCGPLYTSITY
jgi:hypothetical protein